MEHTALAEVAQVQVQTHQRQAVVELVYLETNLVQVAAQAVAVVPLEVQSALRHMLVVAVAVMVVLALAAVCRVLLVACASSGPVTPDLFQILALAIFNQEKL